VIVAENYCARFRKTGVFVPEPCPGARSIFRGYRGLTDIHFTPQLPSANQLPILFARLKSAIPPFAKGKFHASRILETSK
jgi:hypothetical protein